MVETSNLARCKFNLLDDIGDTGLRSGSWGKYLLIWPFLRLIAYKGDYIAKSPTRTRPRVQIRSWEGPSSILANMS